MLKRIKNLPGALKFLILVLVLFCGIGIFAQDIFIESIQKSLILFRTLVPTLLLVFIFIFIFNLIITDKFVKKHLHKNVGIIHYIAVAVVAILSTGPIYMWYAYLSNVKKEGVSDGLISLFLYNRAIKLPLLPLMISYFSLKTTIIVTLLTLIFSFLNAILINLFNKQYNHENSNRINN